MKKKLITLALDAPISEAHKIMTQKKIRHLPILGPSGDVLGILSDRDVMRAMRPSKEPMAGAPVDYDFDPRLRVSDFMSWPVITTTGQTPLLEITRRMVQSKVSSLLVTDATGGPAGIVTTEDLLKLLARMLEKEKPAKPVLLGDVITDYQFGENHWA